MKDFYVYVYIDPRNLEEFYYGKGRGGRKDAHLKDKSDSEKAKRIRSILKEGLSPIIRVIASNLSEHDALLVEKTLLWKLGKGLTNISTGHYSNNFRPHNTFHKKISGFDFKNVLYYYNVGEGDHRNWDDFKKFGFISAGQAPRFRDAMLRLEVGDIIVAYLKRHGFVGIGRIIQNARPAKDVSINDKQIFELPLKQSNLIDNCNDLEKSEYVAIVDWVESKDRKNAEWKAKSGLFTTQLVTASLEAQPKTKEFLESRFEVNFDKLLT